MVGDRPTWDDYFLNIAGVVASRGDCTRSKVGAVLVDKHKIIIATGFNGVAPGAVGCLAGACPRGRQSYGERPPGGDYRDCIATHAERNALNFALKAQQRHRVWGSSVYITREPCDGCRYALWCQGVIMGYWPGEESGVLMGVKGYEDRSYRL